VVTSGRHRRDVDTDLPWYESRRLVGRRAGWLLRAAAAAGVAVLVVAALAAGSLLPAQVAGRSTCDGLRTVATVAASPNHAPVLRRIAAEWSLGQPRVGAACAEVEVVAAPSAAVASVLGSAGAGGRPDAWAPESAVWPALAATRPEAAAALPQTGIGLAATPIVIAVPRERAAALGWPARPVSWPALLGGLRDDPTWGRYGHGGWGRFLVGMTDPARSTAALHTLLAVTDADADGTVEPVEVANELLLERSVAVYAAETEQLLARAGGPAALSAFPATEQAVLAHNAAAAESGGRQLVPLYPAEGVADANHPFLVLRGSWVTPQRRQVVQDFADFALGTAGREAYARAGFRDRDRSPRAMPVATADARTVPRTYPTRALPAAAQAAQALVRWRALRRPATLLAVIDTSGSMAERAPGLPVSKLAVFQQAAAQAVRLFNVRSQIGLWEFSARLVGPVDHRRLVPPRPLGTPVGGATQREAVIAAVNGMRSAGGTGLYDTIDAAYRESLRIWRKDQQNVLMVMTDGKNEDAVGLSLAELMRSLRKQQDRARPVTVILIAYGRDADLPVLDQVATAAGGRTYVARDPADIGKVFLAAMVNR
jgi:Ca-activated chloride channel family protein